ncbi:MAG: hypothetical protein Q9173_000544 [Seirophora scorigena]
MDSPHAQMSPKKKRYRDEIPTPSASLAEYSGTQAYLKDPPPEYQQPPVDLFGGLANLKDQVEAGQFKNECNFEVAVQKLILATHDAHINLAYDDLLEAQYDEADWTPSAVVEINGIEASKFLKDFAAANVQGYIEPHADWNNWMSSAASDIQFMLSTF